MSSYCSIQLGSTFCFDSNIIRHVSSSIQLGIIFLFDSNIFNRFAAQNLYATEKAHFNLIVRVNLLRYG